MQTNREDVGSRYKEIMIPLAPDEKTAREISQHFRKYYLTIAEARTSLQKYLSASNAHHFFVSGAEALDTLEVENDAIPIDESVELD